MLAMENGVKDWREFPFLMYSLEPVWLCSLPSWIILFLTKRLMELSEGTSSTAQTLSRKRCSLSSQQNAPGSFFRYSSIFLSISAVMTLGRPACCEGSTFPVSWYLDKSLLTHPCVTFNCRLISHWRTPRQERLIIWDRNSTGSGFPLTYMPPSWLSLPSPAWKTFVILLSFSRPMYLMWTYTPFAIAGWMLKIITSWYTDPKTTNRQRFVFKNKLNVCYQVPECFNLHVVNMFFFCSEVLYGS